MKLRTSPVCCTSVGIVLLAAFTPLIYILISENTNCKCRNNSTGWKNKPKREEKQLVIGILSARENFKERQTIRETWIKDTYEGGALEKVLFKFVIGSKSCDVHVQNRKDLYSCEELNFTYTTDHGNQNFALVSLEKKADSELHSDVGIIWNTSVIVRHPVVVKRIGLHTAVELSEAPVIVQLYDENTEEVVISARFNSLDPGITDGTNSDDLVSYRFQAVSHVLLPKGYECSLRIIFDGDITSQSKLLRSSASINNSGGTVELLPMDEKGFYVEYGFENKIFMGNLVVSINDVDKLKSIKNRQALLNEEHLTAQTEISHRLEKETSIYQDILFVNVTDVYRNLPLKLLHFHQWINSELNAQFVMKTDDDCFVNIENILIGLDRLPKVNKIWWGNFRDNWFVERVGKWAEKMFRASEYPQFACGSGNIVSKDVSDWLARNAEDLFPYQGEDTSMGIWLSALATRYFESKEWFCGKGCAKDAFVIPQLSVQEMHSLWESKQKCDNICGCG